MGKKLLVCLLAAVLGISAVGCGSSGATETSTEEAEVESKAFSPKLDTEEEVTINIIGTLENFESLEAVINDFTEYYPNCEVLYECMENYRAMLSTRLASDDSVGIFMVNNTTYTGEVQDKCADLSQEDIDTSAIQSEALSACTDDSGKLYELPLALNTSGLIVNNTLLENEGLSVPTNYEEFMSVCESLKDKGYTPVQGYLVVAELGVIQNMIYVQLSKTYNTQEALETLTAGEDGCADSLLPAFELLSDLHEKGYIDMAVNTAEFADSYNEAILRFFEGDVPFLAGTTETFSGTKKRETKSEHFSEEPFEYEFICTPIAENGAYSYLENWQGFALNKDCTDKEWAVEFMRFLATKEEINELAYIKGLPSVAVESDDARFDGLYTSGEDTTYTNDSYFPTIVGEALYKAVEALAAGEVDAQGAVDKMETILQTGVVEDDAE